MPKGAIALVNGEIISLRGAQALLDTTSGSLVASPRPSLAEMRHNYAQATSILVVNALVRQDLASRGLQVSDAELEKFIEGIKKDYGENDFAEALADISLREDDWRQFMKDYLARQLFMNNVILPRLRVSLEEIRNYYEEHKAEFARPKLYRLCYAAADDRQAIEEWCNSGDAAVLGNSHLAQCMASVQDEVPPPWQDEVRKLKLLECGKIVRVDDQWRAAALLGKEDARVVPLSEAYALIENILLQQKSNDEFDKWLKNRLENSHILGSPDLFPVSEARSESEAKSDF